MRAISGGARSATADEALLVITMYSTQAGSGTNRDAPLLPSDSMRSLEVIDRAGYNFVTGG